MNRSSATASSQLLTMQIIWLALLTGVLFFAAVAFFLHPKAPPEFPLISYAALAIAAGAIAMSFVVSMVIGSQLASQVSSAPNRSEEEMEAALTGAFQTRLIISLAILEGAAFFALVAFLIEGLWWTFAAAGVIWFLMLLRFPTATRLEDWRRSERENALMNRQQ